MNKKMNGYLADLMLEAHKLQAYHWYVKGPDFYMVHAQLEEYYNEVSAMVDEVAEALLMCGEQPITTLKEIADGATLKQEKATFITSDKIYAATLKDYQHLLETAEGVKEKAEKDGNELISIKMDAHIETLSKAIWMLSQSLA